jgi:hypothetical protein
VDEADIGSVNRKQKVDDFLEKDRPLFVSRYMQYTQ